MPQSNTGKAGLVVAPSDGNGMDKLASSLLDDLLYNVIHDLIMKTHRDEKQARAATAAIRVETIASEAAQDLAGATGESKPEGHHETEGASYENGQVTLKGNPLKTTHDILCPRCHLPRLLYPTDGRGARKPDPSVTYCKKHPYIDKPGCDIYGQMWVAPGPGRGKKKKDFEKKVSAAIHAATTGIESPDGPNGTGTTEQRPPNVMSFPSATCSKCKRCILVSRLNNHMGSCIGNSGRNASRAAAAKISNGGGPGNENTPPSSQKGTPLPSSQGSPRKRDADDFFDDGYEESELAAGGANGSQTAAKPKKKFKTSASASQPASALGSGTPTGGANTPSLSSSQGLSVALSKKLTLKMKNAAGGSMKKQKAKPSSALSFERKISSSYDDDDDDENEEEGDEHDNDKSRDYVDDYEEEEEDDDDDRTARSNSANFRSASASGTIANGNGLSNGQKPKKKKQMLLSATSTPPKKTTKVPIPIPGKKVKLVNKTPLSPPASKNGRMRDIDAESESSGTMSSPRA